MNSFFDKIIYTPIPDYSSSVAIWRALIEKNLKGPVPPSFDVQTLAYSANGYASGTV